MTSPVAQSANFSGTPVEVEITVATVAPLVSLTGTGSDSFEGPENCPWVCLTRGEQIANINRMLDSTSVCLDLQHDECIAHVVDALRCDPWVEIQPYQRELKSICNATRLHWAVWMDDGALVRYILDSDRVDKNAHRVGPFDATALQYAIHGGPENYSGIVEDLLNHGADVWIQKRFGGDTVGVIRRDHPFWEMLKKALTTDVNHKCDEEGRTVLHIAAECEAVFVVRYLLRKNADVTRRDNEGMSALQYAAQRPSLFVFADEVVRCFVERNFVKTEHDTVRGDEDDVHAQRTIQLFTSLISGNVEVTKELLANAVATDVNFKDRDGKNALHYAVETYDVWRRFKDLERQAKVLAMVKILREKDVDMNAKSIGGSTQGYSPMFLAVELGHTDVVNELLKSKEKILLMGECKEKTLIEVAFDNNFKEIKQALLESEAVARYVNGLYRDRQVYVDAANAILVGAALIAGVTFASWLQPPLGYTTPYSKDPSGFDYVDLQHSPALRAFWVFNTLSFYFAIATVVCGARSVLPRRRVFIKHVVAKLRVNLLVTSWLLACSVISVLIAFGIAGCIVLTPILTFQWYMIGPTIFGGIACAVSLFFLFKSLIEEQLGRRKDLGRPNLIELM